MKEYSPNIIAQVKVCGNEHTYCGHPVYAGEIFYFGNNEIAFMHTHTDDVNYNDAYLGHGQLGVHAKAKVLLTRSYDGGMTWKEEDKSVVFDWGAPVEEQEALLANEFTEETMPPVTDQTLFHWGVSFCGPYYSDGVRRALQPFMVRSDDKGHTWSEKTAIPFPMGSYMQPSSGPCVRQGNRWLKPFQVSTVPETDNVSPEANYRSVLYASENNGVTWQYVSDIARDIAGEIRYAYAVVVDLGQRHLLGTTGNWWGPDQRTRWISVCHSYDNGLNWTEPKRIQSFGVSPYTLRLRDGRVLMIYARRIPASLRGIYGMISEDEGHTWSNEFALRKGASSIELGYPVAVETEDNRIFTGYYYTVEEGLPNGGARHIAGTIFTI